MFCLFKDFFRENTTNLSIPFVIRYRRLNESTIDAFTSTLSQHDFSTILAMNSVNDAFLEFERVLMSLYDACCTVVTKHVSYKDFSKPWIDGNIKSEIRRRNNYLKLFRSGRMGREQFNRMRNRVTKSIRVAKRNYFANKFELVKSDLKRTWSLINKTIKPSFHRYKGNIYKMNIDDRFTDDLIS